MTIPNGTETAESPLWRDILQFCRARITSRRGLLTLAAIPVLAGIVLNWNWLVTAGIAPVLVAVLPCLIMCGLGMCMNKMMGSSCESGPSSVDPDIAIQTATRRGAGDSTGSVPVVASGKPTRSRARQKTKEKEEPTS